MNKIFRISKSTSELFLEIALNNMRLNIAECNNIDLPSEILDNVFGQNIIVSGRGPLWLYMYLVLQLHFHGAKKILLKQAQHDAVDISPSVISQSSNKQIVALETFEKTLVCEYLCSRNTILNPSDLPELLAALPEKPDAYDRIVLSGKMPIWLAGAAALNAYQKGWNNIECFVPQEGGTVAVTPYIHCGEALPQLKHPGVVIGVIGDPNSGKSVFSELLEQSGNLVGGSLWRFDCDYAAPTPNWYLDMLKLGKGEKGKVLRSSYKRKWIPGAEEELVSDLNNMRKYIPLIIADLPGGRHEEDLVQRIPCGREVLLKSIDYFIIVAKIDNGLDTGIAWKNELKTIGKENDIILTIYSEHIDIPTALTLKHNIWHISGLSRDAKPVVTEVKKQLWQLVWDSVDGREIPMEIQV